NGSYRDPDAIVLEGIDRLGKFFREIGLPSTLGELGIDESKLEVMARKATKDAFGSENPLGGLKKLYWKDVLEIYKLAK
ncbi:MAG: iron-containing alcohol dehydrogenase, partial [Treponema sp.]|nr:iron-containing alcohol dehydrogenase [Treponema sp.]MDR1106497.1 iron-containing alcohol dehydrogenase [Treponema sp.]